MTYETARADLNLILSAHRLAEAIRHRIGTCPHCGSELIQFECSRGEFCPGKLEEI